MNTLRKAVLSLAVAAAACGPLPEGLEGIDPVTGEGVAVARQSLVVDELYNKLREAEGLLPVVPPSAQINVGVMNASNGSFSGLVTTYRIDPITKKPVPMMPGTSIDGIDAIAVFSVSPSDSLTVTVNGKTVSGTGSVSINVGRATRVDWTMNASGWQRSDKFFISRPDVIGAGAFTLAALPISIVYEPPMNAARTNSASIGFREEMTTITSVSNGSSNSAAPKWATGVVMKDVLDRLSKHWKPAAAVKNALSVGKTLIGSVDVTTTSGTTVNHDSTLGISQVHAQTVSTNAKLGPGQGDLIVFYKDARVVWGMEQGQVTLSLVDHGPLAMVTVATLKSDLAAAKAGQVAPVTGLDAPTLEALIRLDPLASPVSRPRLPGLPLFGGVSLPASRFTKETSLILSGSSFQNSISHTITQSDRTSTSSTTTTVKNCHPGWLSVIGIGQTQAGTFTSSVSLGSSRTDSVSSTVSASFSLSAAAGESYAVDVHYDNIFGSFLTRLPPPPPPVFEQLEPTRN